MTADDLDIIVSSVAPVMREFVTSRLEGLLEKVGGLETRLELVEKRPEPVAPVALDEHALIDRVKSEVLAALPVPQDGKDGASVTTADVEPLVIAAVQQAVAAIPKPKDGEPGRSVDIADVEALVTKAIDMADVKALVQEAVAAIPHAKDGQSVTVEDVAPVIAAEVQKAVASLPAPKDGQDGRSLSVDDVAPLITSEVQKAVATIPAPKDGVGIAGALIDRAGQLVVTLSDGATKDLGIVVGRDADPDEMARLIAAEVAKIPIPKDGAPGRDGTLENLKAMYDGDGTLTFCFKDGTPIEGGVLELPVPLFKGNYDTAATYRSGHAVKYDGSMWIAMKATTGVSPGDVTAASKETWALAVMRGRQGKEGPQGMKGLDGKIGPQGPQGRAGYGHG